MYQQFHGVSFQSISISYHALLVTTSATTA